MRSVSCAPVCCPSGKCPSRRCFRVRSPHRTHGCIFGSQRSTGSQNNPNFMTTCGALLKKENQRAGERPEAALDFSASSPNEGTTPKTKRNGDSVAVDGTFLAMEEDAAWRTGPISLAKAAAAESAKRAAVTRYTAFGRRPENIIQNPSNRRFLSELQDDAKPRRLSHGRLRELSTTKLGLQLQERMAALVASDSEFGSFDSGSQTRVGRRRSAAASALSAQKPRRRRTRLKDVPAESMEALKLLLSSCGLPKQYASALACFGFSSVGELTRATHQNLLDVGLRPNHARTLRRMLESAFDSKGQPLTPAEEPTVTMRGRPASAPLVRSTAPRQAPAVAVPVEVDDFPRFAENYTTPTPQAVGASGPSPLATASPDLEGLLSTLELTGETTVPQTPLSPKDVVAAELADAAADVAADILADRTSTAGLAQPRSNPAERPQSAGPTGRPTAEMASPAAASTELDATQPPSLSLEEMEERLQSEVLKLDELERIETELQAEIARLRAAGTQAGIVTGDGVKIRGAAKPRGRRRGVGRGSARGGRRRRS